MVNFIIITFLVSIIIIGFLSILDSKNKLILKQSFTDEYRTNFIQLGNEYFKTYERYLSQGNINESLYVWLTLNANKMQVYLSSFGFVVYQPASVNYIQNKYPVIFNTIPKFKTAQILIEDASLVDDCLLRYIGYLNERIEVRNKEIKNPIVWFREGMKEIISWPIIILSWFQIISTNKVQSIKNNLIYKSISGIIALAAFLSSLVTIIAGYEPTIIALKNIFYSIRK